MLQCVHCVLQMSLHSLHYLSKVADAKMLEQKKKEEEERLIECVRFTTVSFDEKYPEVQTQADWFIECTASQTIRIKFDLEVEHFLKRLAYICQTGEIDFGRLRIWLR